MAELSPAERMLKNSTETQYLIRQLQALKAAPIPRVGIHLSPDTKANIATFQGYLQGRIDELSTQRGKAVELVKRIPDQTAQEILLMRYGLTGSGREMSWEQRNTYPEALKYQGFSGYVLQTCYSSTLKSLKVQWQFSVLPASCDCKPCCQHLWKRGPS